MGFVKRIKDIASGRIAASNVLIWNHAIKICDKVAHSESIHDKIVICCAASATTFLEYIILDMADFTNKDGTIEHNPFKHYINRLNRNSSYIMFKLVSGAFLALLLGELHFNDMENIEDCKNNFFNVYEYTQEDINVFDEFISLFSKNESPSTEYKIFSNIFERAYNMPKPEGLLDNICEFEKACNMSSPFVSLHHFMHFTISFRRWFRDVFSHCVCEALGIEPPSDQQPDGENSFENRVLCEDEACIGILNSEGICTQCGRTPAQVRGERKL
jgi:hypothetical protein